ncbi:EAL domain-containing protein [Erwinia sp. CPCC 100877]|nr:EAL domain-containing protein [Erwinia sp. CPCC 100877]
MFAIGFFSCLFYEISQLTQSMKAFYNSAKQFLIILLMTAIAVPILRAGSPIVLLEQTPEYIAYIPITFAIAVVSLFGLRAMAPLFIGFFIALWSTLDSGPGETLLIVCALILPVGLFYLLLEHRLGKKAHVCFGSGHVIASQLLFYGLLYPVTTQMLLYLVGYILNIQDDFQYYFSQHEAVTLIINLQSFMLPVISFTAAFYHLLRMLFSPTYARRFYLSYILPEMHSNTLIWLLMLAALLSYFCAAGTSMILSGYCIPLIFLTFIYGMVHVNYRLISVLWSLSVYLLIQNNDAFTDLVDREKLLVCFSALFIVFNIANIYLSGIQLGLGKAARKLQSMALTDPLLQIPNMRALEQALPQAGSGDTLCFISVSGLERLEKLYGPAFRLDVARRLTNALQPRLQRQESVYQIPGCDALFTLRGGNVRRRLQLIHQTLMHLEINWRGESVELDYTLAWGALPGDKADLYQLICELGHLAKSGDHSSRLRPLHDEQDQTARLISKTAHLYHKVKAALEQDGLRLYQQKIQGPEPHDSYAEVLSRLAYGSEILTPDQFLSLINEFDLCEKFDMQVLDKVLATLASHSDFTCHYSVNLMPATLGCEGIAGKILALFARHQVATSCITIEVTEEQLFLNEARARENLARLRESGIRIAIDDFGRGYANYERMKSLQADVIKIDGLFVRNILHDALDQKIVKSICEIASEKKMQVVAEFVESGEHQKLLQRLGVSHMQGYFIGKPLPFPAVV